MLRQNTRSSEFGKNYENYINCLNIGFGRFDFTVIESNTNKILLYESYELIHVRDDIDLLNVLKQIYLKHDDLQVGFWKKIIVNFSTPKHTLIPVTHYTVENRDSFLKLNTSVDEKSEVIESVKYSKQEVVSVFAISKKIKNWLCSIYAENLVLTHDIPSFITGLMHTSYPLTTSQLYVLFKNNYLNIIAFKDGKIMLANSFLCDTTNDFIYYLLLVSEELNAERTTTTAYFYGDLDDRSDFFQEAQKYFGQTVLGTSSTHFQYSDDISDFRIDTHIETVGAYFLMLED